MIAVALLGLLAFVWNGYLQELHRVKIAAATAVESQKEAIIENVLRLEAEALAKEDADLVAGIERWQQVIQETEAWMDAHPEEGRTGIATPQLPVSDSLAEDQHWAFKRLQPVTPPDVKDTSWVRNPVDRFILARLEEQGLHPRPMAEPRILARRLSLDLRGLSPKQDEVEKLQSAGHEGFDRYAERLLSDPAFGERFATPWLDAVRYADSNGYEEDELRPNAYPYRDFVIWAFNYDLPYDEFIRWQIAGDELAPNNPLAVAATGFIVAAPYNTFMPQESERYDELDNVVSTLGSSMLGLTVGCARCHDHPYDAISTEEYYSLISIFKSTARDQRYLLPDQGKKFSEIADPVLERRAEIREMLLDSAREDNIADLDFTEEEKDILRQPLDPQNEEQIRLLSLCGRCLMVDDTFIDETSQPLPKDKQRYDRLMAELKLLEPDLPPTPPKGLTVRGSEVVTTPILWGGKLESKGAEVGPRFLSTLTEGTVDWEREAWKTWDPQIQAPRARSALAHWVTDLDHGAGPLLARVIVNDLWQLHFGTGLVSTPSDFGQNGEKPSHPELLEWLAYELVDSGWSLKHIHRLILQSATYRQDSHCSPETFEVDPENRLLTRWRPQRMTAEAFRDSILSLNGNLNRLMYGPSFQPAIPREAIFNRDEEDPNNTWPTEVVERPAVWRRSIYIMKRRTNPVPLMQLFDVPNGTFVCSQRRNTTVPTQALALWNSSFMRDQSQRLANQILEQTAPRRADVKFSDEVIQELFQVTLGRPAKTDELEQARRFLQHSGDLTDLCQVMLMTNEFIYIQ